MPQKSTLTQLHRWCENTHA